MRQLKILMLTVLMTTTSLMCFGSQQEQTNTGGCKTIFLLKKYPNSKNQRPKSQSLQKITCTYDGKDIELDFVLPEGDAVLRICDENMQGGRYEIDTTPLDASVHVGALSGEIHIELETALDNVYAGDMYY